MCRWGWKAQASKMSSEARIGFAGVILALIATAAFVLWPNNRTIAWALLALATVLLVVWVWLEVRASQSGWRLRLPFERTDSTTSAWTFDPRTILFEVRHLYLSGLTRAEPFITFLLVVQNASGRDIEITDIKGRVNISGEVCGAPPVLELLSQPTLRLSSQLWENQSLTIRQPVTPGHADRLVMLLQDAGVIAFALAGLELVGTMSAGTTKTALPRCAINQWFRAKGPVDLLNGNGNLIRLDGMFVSQQAYNGEGERITPSS
jgi:hypothetical protein